MKVALVGIKGDFDPGLGAGIQRYMFELYRNLKRLSEGIDKIEFKKVRFIGNGLSVAIQTLFKNFSEYKIIHNLLPVPFFIPFIKPKSCICISTVHDFQPLLYPEFTFEHGTALKDRLWMVFVIKFGLKRMLDSDYLIVNSTQTKEEAIKLGFEGKRIFVINHGIDKRFCRKHGRVFGKKKNVFKVSYIGVMVKRKNIKFAIDSANLIKNQNILFEIWGKRAWEYDYLLHQVKNKNVSFMGFAPEKKLVQIYDSSDVFVFPSLHEGFGLPILEAQARGLPVIIYKYGKIPKEVRKYCFEAKSPEHMAQIIENLKENGYNRKLQKKATEYARSFTWEKTARETLKVYRKVIN